MKPCKKRPSFRRLVLLAGLSLSSVLMTLVVAEGLLRVIPGLLPLGMRVMLNFKQPYTQGDEEMRSRGIPSLRLRIDSHPEYVMDVSLNRLGYRDALTEGKVFAVAVGDSFTFGTGVQAGETYVEQLESLIGQPVVNMGIGGYSPSQYALVLEKDGQHFDPNVVFFAIFGNDVEDCGRFEEFLARPRPRIPPPPPEPKRLALASLFTESMLLKLVQWRFSPTISQVPYRTVLHYRDADLDLEFNEGITSWVRPDQGGTEANWESFDRAIRQAQTYAEEKQASLVVLYIPTKEETYHMIRAGCGGGPELDALFGSMRDRIRRSCEAARVDFLDLTPTFRQHAQAKEQLYFRWDGHWNVRGHALAAQTIHEFLTDRGLLPSSPH